MYNTYYELSTKINILCFHIPHHWLATDVFLRKKQLIIRNGQVKESHKSQPEQEGSP